MILRKQFLQPRSVEMVPAHDEIPVVATATIYVTSETPDHPVDYIFDSKRGPGGSRWVAQQPGEQMVMLGFDAPQTIRTVLLEIEEQQVSRTQEVTLLASFDGDQTRREILRQEFNFSPPGTTFERERWSVSLEHVTHLLLMIKPDKGRQDCFATITSLVLY
jgi:hypothetical protein